MAGWSDKYDFSSFDSLESYRLYQKNITDLHDVQVAVVCSVGSGQKDCSKIYQIFQELFRNDLAPVFQDEGIRDFTLPGLNGVVLPDSNRGEYSTQARAILENVRRNLRVMKEVDCPQRYDLDGCLDVFKSCQKDIEEAFRITQNCMKKDEDKLNKVKSLQVKNYLSDLVSILKPSKTHDVSKVVSLVFLRFNKFKDDLSEISDSLKEYKVMVFIPKDKVEKPKAGEDPGDRKDGSK